MDTKGAELHTDLIQADGNKVIYIKKGDNPNIDSHSAFFDNMKSGATRLHNELQNEKITDLYVCGLPADVSVGIWNLYFIHLLVTQIF